VFHERHRSVHGHAQPGKPIELVNLRVVHSWYPAETSLELAIHGRSPPKSRVAWFDGASHDTPVIARAELADVREGPLFVQQPDTTVVVEPGQRIRALPDGNLALEVA
jgi:N-methylhydantoinase A